MFFFLEIWDSLVIFNHYEYEYVAGVFFREKSGNAAKSKQSFDSFHTKYKDKGDKCQWHFWVQ